MDEDIQINHNKTEHPQMHSVEHILNQTMVRMFGCKRSMNAHIERKKSKCDYMLTVAPTEEQIAAIERRVNVVIEQQLIVMVEFVTLKDASNMADLSKLPDERGSSIRIVRIGDYDICACAGTHVTNTSEIGRFKIISHDFENERWRVRFKLEQRQT